MTNFEKIKKDAMEHGYTEREIENLTRIGSLARSVAERAFMPVIKELTDRAHEIDEEQSAALFSCTMMPSIIMLAAYSSLEVTNNAVGKKEFEHVLEMLHACIDSAVLKVQELEDVKGFEEMNYDELPDEVKELIEKMGISKDDLQAFKG